MMLIDFLLFIKKIVRIIYNVFGKKHLYKSNYHDAYTYDPFTT